MAPPFSIRAERWYGWQMLPGYGPADRVVPYFSPIYVRGLRRHPNSRRFTLEFINVLYAEGVKDFTVDLSPLRRTSDYLVAGISYDQHAITDRVGIVSHIAFDWIWRCCPSIWDARPPESLGLVEQNSPSAYLHAVFAGLLAAKDDHR